MLHLVMTVENITLERSPTVELLYMARASGDNGAASRSFMRKLKTPAFSCATVSPVRPAGSSVCMQHDVVRTVSMANRVCQYPCITQCLLCTTSYVTLHNHAQLDLLENLIALELMSHRCQLVSDMRWAKLC